MMTKQIMGACVFIFACLVANAFAFVTPVGTLTGLRSPAAARTTSGAGGAHMSCRVNAKKEKRQRNRDNMRRFNKKGVSRQKDMRVERQERAAEAEASFMAKMFHTGMDDMEDADVKE